MTIINVTFQIGFAEINKLLRCARNDVIARSEATKYRVYRGEANPGF